MSSKFLNKFLTTSFIALLSLTDQSFAAVITHSPKQTPRILKKVQVVKHSSPQKLRIPRKKALKELAVLKNQKISSARSASVKKNIFNVETKPLASFSRIMANNSKKDVREVLKKVNRPNSLINNTLIDNKIMLSSKKHSTLLNRLNIVKKRINITQSVQNPKNTLKKYLNSLAKAKIEPVRRSFVSPRAFPMTSLVSTIPSAASATITSSKISTPAAPIVAGLEADRRAAEVARVSPRLDSERVAREAVRLEAVRLEAARLEAARLEADRRAAEVARVSPRLDSERVAREAARLEAARLEADRRAAEVARLARLDSERVAREAARLEAVRLEADRRAAEVARLARLDSERVAREAARRLEADRRAAEVARVTRALEIAREKAARLAAPREDLEKTRTLEIALDLYPGENRDTLRQVQNNTIVNKRQKEKLDDAQLTKIEIYNYIDKYTGSDDAKYNDVIYIDTIRKLKRFLGKAHDESLNAEAGLTFMNALDGIKFHNDLQKDRTKLEKELKQHQEKLRQPGIPHNKYSFKGGLDRFYEAESQRAINKIDTLDMVKRAELIHLNYANLTYKDIGAAANHKAFLPITDDEVQNISRKLSDDFTAIFSVKENDPYLTREMIDQINKTRDNFQQEVLNKLNHPWSVLNLPENRKNWYQRLELIWKYAPAGEVDENIVRPGQARHDPDQWKKALTQSRELVAQTILGALEGCITGHEQKISLIEKGYARHLPGSENVVNIKILPLVGNIIKNIKLDTLEKLSPPIEKLSAKIKQQVEDGTRRWDQSRINDFNIQLVRYFSEKIITTPQQAIQKMKIAFGLMEDYNLVVGAGSDDYNDFHDVPEQIIMNMFLPGQYDRQYEYAPYGRGPFAETYNFSRSFEPLTVKKLVELVCEQFQTKKPNGSIARAGLITAEALIEYRKGNYDVQKDYNNSSIMFANGVFTDPGLMEIHEPIRALHTKTMAFHILETLGYISIDPRVKEKVYKMQDDGRGNEEPGTYTFNNDPVVPVAVRNRTLNLEQIIDLL